MKHIKHKTVFTILFLFFSLTFSMTSLADSNNMTFSMGIVQPENQFNKEVTYFDLLVKPNETQKLEIIVSNTGDETKKIKVTPTNAITSTTGIIDYSVQAKGYEYDETLEIPFTSLVGEAQTVEVPPGKSKTVTFEMTTPEKEFDGVILGGFVAELVEDNEVTNNESDLSFVNKFRFVKAIVIRNSEEKIAPVIKMNDVKPALYTYRTAIVANIQNTSPTLIGKTTFEAKIFKKGTTDVLKSASRDDIRLAPNSNFDFPIMWDNEPLRPGNYTIQMNVTADEETFQFEKDFKITKAQSNSINGKAVELKEDKNRSWIYWLMGAILLIVVVVLIVVIVKQNKKNKRLAKKTKKATKNKSHKKSNKSRKK